MQRSELTANFPADVLGLLDQTDEVQIEPRSPDGQRQPAVTIWVVVLDGLDVYVRSYRGPRGRWYQALLKHPYGVLHVSQREIPFHAIHIDDSPTIARVSEAYRRKYERRWPTETAEMLRDEVLSTTLKLEPAAA
jgi:hypothetical protein